MSLQRNERYPGRFDNPTVGHPQGAFKNRSAPNTEDGSYVERDWANDWDGFFSSLLDDAGLTPNGVVDSVGASQYFDALKEAITTYGSPQATEVLKGIAKIATNALAVAGADDETIITPLKLAQVIAANVPVAAPVKGVHSNLKMSASGTNALVALTCDEIVLKGDDGSYVTSRNVSITGATATVGAGGLDTGVLAANTWYSVWVIAGPAPYAFLMSLSATAPTMPAGWTHKARVGWIRTDGSANKFPLSFIQYNSKVQYVVAAGSNVPGMPNMASGIAGSPNTPTWAPVTVSPFVPPTAASISAVLGAQNSATANLAPNNSYGSWGALVNPPMLSASCQATMFSAVLRAEITLESSNLYWNSDTATSRLYCAGWEDNL